jgi:hypothetical protein
VVVHFPGILPELPGLHMGQDPQRHQQGQKQGKSQAQPGDDSDITRLHNLPSFSGFAEHGGRRKNGPPSALGRHRRFFRLADQIPEFTDIGLDQNTPSLIAASFFSMFSIYASFQSIFAQVKRSRISRFEGVHRVLK